MRYVVAGMQLEINKVELRENGATTRGVEKVEEVAVMRMRVFCTRMIGSHDWGAGGYQTPAIRETDA